MPYLQSTRVSWTARQLFFKIIRQRYTKLYNQTKNTLLSRRVGEKILFLFSLVPSLAARYTSYKKHIIMRKTERKIKTEPFGTFGIPPEHSSLPRSLPHRYRGHLHPEAKSILANASAAWKSPSPGQPEKCRQLFDLGVYRGSPFKGRRVQSPVSLSVCVLYAFVYIYVLFLKLFLLS